MLGQDVCFDLQNYHLYIPYAFLNGRLGTDIIPAGALHTFFNPLLDVLPFLLFKHLNNWPVLTGFIMGGIYGLFLFALWKVLGFFFPGPSRADKWLRAGALCLAGTGLASLAQIGRYMNEIQTAFIIMLSCWFLCKAAFGGRPEQKYAFFAVFTAFLAAGLKYTAGPAAVGVFLASLPVFWRNGRSRGAYAMLAVCAVSGFLLADGYFLWKKWVSLGSPLFPYFNHIFHSPFFAADSLPNGFGTPRGLKEWLFLPFLRFNFPVLEYRLDFRLALGLLSFVGFFIWRFTRKKAAFSTGQTLAMCLFAGTYVPWVLLFGNMRYAICLEVFSSVLFILFLRVFFSFRTALAVSLLVWACVLPPLPDFHRQPFPEKNMSVSGNVSVPDGAFVLLAGHISFLVPFLNPNARYAGGVYFLPEKLPAASSKELSKFNWLQPADYRHYFAPSVREAVQLHPGPVYVLAPVTRWVWQDSLWEEYGLRVLHTADKCRFFHVSLDVLYDGFVLCEAQKVSPKYE